MPPSQLPWSLDSGTRYKIKFSFLGTSSKISQAEYVPDWKEFLRESDIISAHCPLTKETRHLFNQEAFSLMKETAIFINTSRGDVVDQEALFQVRFFISCARWGI